MTYLCISNRGELDPRGITLIGASVKTSDDAIGEFGSGFSYALGVLLRGKLDVRIWSGEREIKIESREETFRGTAIKVLYVDGERTSLTENIGPKWRFEEAIRELWSNALDEGDEKRVIAHGANVMGEPGRTTIMIEMNRAITDMWHEWDSYFISPTAKPVYKDERITIYRPEDTGGNAAVYRRGVYVQGDTKIVPTLSFSLQSLNLPESRLISSATAVTEVTDVLSDINDPSIIAHYYKMVRNDERAEELDGISRYSNFADAVTCKAEDDGFKYVCDLISRPNLDKDIERETMFFDRNFQTYGYFIRLPNAIREQMRRNTVKKPYTVTNWPPGERERMNGLIDKLVKAGISFRWKIAFGEFPYANILAYADMDESLVVIGRGLLKKDDSLVLSGLIEEHIHLNFKVVDRTVEQQHAYLQTIVNLVLRLTK